MQTKAESKKDVASWFLWFLETFRLGLYKNKKRKTHLKALLRSIRSNLESKMKNKIIWLLTITLFILACNIFARIYGYIFDMELFEAKLEIVWGCGCGAVYTLLHLWYSDTHQK